MAEKTHGHQHFTKLALILLFLISGNSDGKAQNQTRASAYCLPHTEVRKIHSEHVDVDYVLYISLPRNYTTSQEVYPVIFTLDADYSFALAHNIIEHFVERDNLPEMIVVGIAYEGASQEMNKYRKHRSRDYTPTYTLEGGYGPEFQKYSGGGEKFRTFIISELIPFMESNYRVEPDNRTFVGHSYGGLFGTYVLLTRPDLFQKYILVSPSLWYDDKMMLKMAGALTNPKSLAARVFFGMGSYENQPWRGRAMISDMQSLVEILQSHFLPELEITSHVFEGETHNSVFPAALTRGLRVVFEGEVD